MLGLELTEQRDLARRMCADHVPDWVIGSPPCTDFSVMGRWNHRRMQIEDVRRRLREARRHLEFCVVLYRDQLARGKHLSTRTSSRRFQLEGRVHREACREGWCEHDRRPHVPMRHEDQRRVGRQETRHEANTMVKLQRTYASQAQFEVSA